MRGPLSRWRERVGVRVFARRQSFVSREFPTHLAVPGVGEETSTPTRLPGVNGVNGVNEVRAGLPLDSHPAQLR